MDRQVEAWGGEFGQAYTERNVVAAGTREAAFRTMLQDLALPRVLEVGCNRGHNLVLLANMLGVETEIVGIDPNRFALRLARKASSRISALVGHAADIPFKDHYFDLVFTAGVLIHIPPESLTASLSEIYRVSRRYILAIEYFAAEDTAIVYRGQTDLLWKRDFLACYQTQFPDLTVRSQGYWGLEDGFDRTHWWLLEKGGSEERA